MYPPELEKLMDYAILDGQITEKERNILIRKAISLGIDQDEFEMVLDAKIQEYNIAKNNDQNSSQKSDKQSKRTRCPNCQSPIEAFTTNCEYCQHDFNIEHSVSSINRLFTLLNEVEDQRRKDPSNPFQALGRVYSDAFTNLTGPSKVDRKKMEIISSFPIPTSKEDLLEFLSLAYPLAQQKGNFFTKHNPENKSHNLFVNLWENKCEQIIIKAKFAMKNDPETLEQIMQYARKLNIA